MRVSTYEFRALSCFLQDNDSLIEHLETLRKEHFSVLGYGKVFEIMSQLCNSGVTFDDQVLMGQIEEQGVDQNNCNEKTVKEMWNSKPFKTFLNPYVSSIKSSYEKTYLKSRIKELSLRLDSDSYTDTDSVVNELNDLTNAINDKVIHQNCVKSSINVEDFLQSIDAKLLSKEHIIDGLKTGIDELDWGLNGLNPGKLYTLVADSRVGKSRFALQTALNICQESKDNSVHFFSLEMPKEELIENAISILSGINNTFFKQPKLYFCDRVDGVVTNTVNEDKKRVFYNKIRCAAEKLNNMNLFIDFDATISSASDIIARAKKQNLAKKTSLIIIDHTDRFCSLNSDIAFKTKETYVGLKNLARVLDVPVLALHQFNDKLSNNPDMRPTQGCIKGGTAIFAESDVVLFIYRPSVYKKLCEDNPELRDICFIECIKHRGGMDFDNVDMTWNGIKFSNKLCVGSDKEQTLKEKVLEDSNRATEIESDHNTPKQENDVSDIDSEEIPEHLDNFSNGSLDDFFIGDNDVVEDVGFG